MGYIITTKIKVIEGEINRTPIAFPNTVENVETFTTWCDWNVWVDENLKEDSSLPEHIDNPVCYEGKCQSDSIQGMELTIVEVL